MAETTYRTLRQTVHAPGGDVLVTTHEEYSPDNPDVPIHVKIVARGMTTEGDNTSAWREMQVLLGITPPPEESSKPVEDRRDATEFCSLEVKEEPITTPQAQLEEDPPMANLLKEELMKTLSSDAEANETKDEIRSGSPTEPISDISLEELAEINQLSSESDIEDFNDELDRKIKLALMRESAARRVVKLKHLTKANQAKRCRHVKPSGQTCGSPAEHGQDYCHYHGGGGASGLEIRIIEDRRAFQIALAQLANQLASNKIEPAQAKVLLQVLETAGRGFGENFVA